MEVGAGNDDHFEAGSDAKAEDHDGDGDQVDRCLEGKCGCRDERGDEW